MRTLRCYRCANVWRPRKDRVRTCPLCKSTLWNLPKPVIVAPFDPENRAWKDVVEPHRAEILEIARQHHAKNVRVFGSVRRNEATKTSDLDLLVTMEPSSTILDQIGLKQDLERRLKRKVDVVSDQSIFWYLEPQIRAEAIPL